MKHNQFYIFSRLIVLLTSTGIFLSCVRDIEEEGIFTTSSIVGQVLEQSSQQPVANIHVALYRSNDSTNALTKCSSDDDGHFSLPIEVLQQAAGCVLKVFADSLYSSTSVSVPTSGLGKQQCNIGVIYVSGAEVPSISNLSINNISAVSVDCSATITSDNRSSITSRGFVFSTMQFPTLSDGHISIGGSVGPYSSTINGLHAATIYYIRAFARNGHGIAYSDQIRITTLPGLAIVHTDSTITTLTTTSVSCGGSIDDDGGFLITSRGLCYSINTEPTVQNMHTSEGSGIGPFTSILSTLTPATTYHLRAYATNANGTAYGEERIFQTPTGLPIVQTSIVTDISTTSAICGGVILSNGGFNVISRGVCFSSTPNPTTDSPHTTDGSNTGPFISNLFNLSPSTTYYVRAYATNALGTVYGEEHRFTTLTH